MRQPSQWQYLFVVVFSWQNPACFGYVCPSEKDHHHDSTSNPRSTSLLQKNTLMERAIIQMKMFEQKVDSYHGPLIASALVRDVMVRDVQLHTTISHTGMLLGLLLTVLLGLALCTGLHFRSVVGGAAKRAVERIDKYLLGVDSSVEVVDINPFLGKLTCNRIILSNPHGYESPYLLKAAQLHITIDMKEYFRSRFYHLSIEKLILTDIQVHYEHGKGGRSNTHDVIQYLTDGDTPDAGEQPQATPWLYRDVRVSLHEFKIQDLVVQLHHLGPLHTVDCSDICYKDYDTEVGDSVIEDLAIFLLKTILKTVVCDVAEHMFHIASLTGAVTRGAEKIKKACPAAVSACLCGVCSCSGCAPRSEPVTTS